MSRTSGKIRLDGKFALAERVVRSTLPGGWWLWCSLGLALGFSIWIGGRSLLRRQLAEQLTTSQSEQVALASIEALLLLDGDATAEVARALGHPQFVVANAAYRALGHQMQQWETLADVQRVKRLAELVGQIEQVKFEESSDHCILVRGLVSRIYAECLPQPGDQAAGVLASCKRLIARSDVLISAAPASFSPTSLPPLDSASAATSGSGSQALPKSSFTADDGVPPPLPPPASALAGTSAVSPTSMPMLMTQATGSPLVSSQTAILPRSSAPSSKSNDSVDATERKGAIHLTSSPVSIMQSDPPMTAMRLSESDDLSADTHYADRAPPISTSTASASSSVSEPHVDVAGLEDLSIDRLVRLLGSVQPRIAQASALALRRKGLSEDKLTLAVSLANGGSSERKRLLETLASREDLDPRPWLLWMAEEGEPSVREQAIGLLSPLLDNEVRRQLRLLLNRERDEQVAQTIRRVLVGPSR